MENKRTQQMYGYHQIKANVSTIAKITANRENVPIPVSDLFASSKAYVWMMRTLIKSDLIVEINKLDVIWKPQIEPTGGGKVEISVIHVLSKNDDNPLQENSGVVLKAYGNASESLAVRLFPSSSHILGEKDTILLPWEVEFSTNVTIPNDTMTIGILKIECDLKIRTFNHRKLSSKPYKDPMIYSSGLHFPCYKAAMVYKTPNKYSIGWSRQSPVGQIWESEIMPYLSSLMKNTEEKWKVQNIIGPKDVSTIRDAIKEQKDRTQFIGCPISVRPDVLNTIKSLIAGSHTPYITLEEVDNERKALSV